MEPRERREEGPSRGRDMIATVAAILAHAAVIAIAWPFATTSLSGSGAPATTSGLIEIDLPEAKPPESPPPAKSTEAEPGEREDARSEPRSGPARATRIDLPAPPGPEGAPSSAAAPEPPSPAPPAPVSEYGAPSMVPLPGGDGLGGTGILGGPVWAIPGGMPPGPDAPGARRPEPPKVPVGPRATVATGKGTTLLRDDMRARDAKLGLGNPGGTLVQNAVAEAVRGSSLGTDATAVLVAHVGGDGTVTSVSVAQFSAGDAKLWNGIAQAAKAAIGKKKLGLAGLGGKGATVRVRVTSKLTYPSGGGGDEKKGATELPSAVAKAIADGPDRTVAPAQGPDGDACAPERWSDLKPLCGVGMTVGRFDITDIATRKHRYVSASFTVNVFDEIAAALLPEKTPPAPPAAATAGAPSPPPAVKQGAP